MKNPTQKCTRQNKTKEYTEVIANIVEKGSNKIKNLHYNIFIELKPNYFTVNVNKTPIKIDTQNDFKSHELRTIYKRYAQNKMPQND